MKRRNWLKIMIASTLVCTAAAFAEDTAPSSVNTPIKGNTESKIYHKPDCRHYTAQGTTAVFKSEEEAIKAGYKPCKICAVPKAEKKAEKKMTDKAEKKTEPAE